MNNYLMDFKEGLRKCLLLILCVLGLKFFRKKLYRPPNKTDRDQEQTGQQTDQFLTVENTTYKRNPYRGEGRRRRQIKVAQLCRKSGDSDPSKHQQQ